MAQLLRAGSTGVWGGYLLAILSTHIRQHTTTYRSNSRGSDALCWLLGHLHMCGMHLQRKGRVRPGVDSASLWKDISLLKTTERPHHLDLTQVLRVYEEEEIP